MSDKYETIQDAKSRAEDVQARFDGIKAVLGAVNDYIYHQFIDVELERRSTAPEPSAYEPEARANNDHRCPKGYERQDGQRAA